MYALSIYGKGGIGKSTISANISYGLSMKGFKVLHVGCDPKHDSTITLMNGVQQRTFMDHLVSGGQGLPIEGGSNGVYCVECGGASPGTGCAGKGMVRLFDHLRDNSPDGIDIRIHDVLGDVVCGGFSIPMRKENMDAVILVVSEEFMSIYAANNILHGLKNLNDTQCVLGVILNSRSPEKERNVNEFVRAAGLRVLGRISRDEVFGEAEMQGKTVLESFPDSRAAEEINRIIDAVVEAYEGGIIPSRPNPLSDEMMSAIAIGRPASGPSPSERKRVCDFCAYDSERGISYRGDYAVPSCTSHGAVELLQGITDAGVVLHGPRNCAYLMEYAFIRRASKMRSHTGTVSICNLYSTAMDDGIAFAGDAECIARTVTEVAKKGFKTIFIVPTCTPAIMGTDLRRIAGNIKIDGVRIMAVPMDRIFLGSKFGCYSGALECIRDLMDQDTEIIPDTVNLLSFSGPGMMSKENTAEMEKLLGAAGLRINTVFYKYASTESIKSIPSAQYNIQINDTNLNNRMSKILLDGKECKVLKMPNGIYGIREWISVSCEMTGRTDVIQSSLDEAEREYRILMESMKEHTHGRSAIFYVRPENDIDWYIDTLIDMGMDVKCIAHWKGVAKEDRTRRSRHSGIKRFDDVSVEELKDLVNKNGADLIISNGPYTGGIGIRWTGFSTNYTGMRGTAYWARKVRNALRIPAEEGWRECG